MPIDARAIPDLLHWYEGMLLMPEHFQVAGRRQESLAGYLAQIAAPYAWGVRALRYDLDQGVLTVRRLEAVLPDGLLVSLDAIDGGDEALRIDLNPLKPTLENQQRRLVHIVVTAWNDHALEIDGDAAATGRGLTRYRSVRGKRLERDDPDLAADAATEVARERPWLQPLLKLFVPDSEAAAPPARYVGLPLLRLYQNAQAAIVVDRFEPPRPDLAADGHLVESARDIAGELRAKARFLGEKLRDHGRGDRSGAGLPALSMESQLQMLGRRFEALRQNVDNLQALARTLPRLEALLHEPAVHPFTLYLALCDVVGDIALLGGVLNLPDVPRYLHTDPLAAFDSIERHIRLVLEMLDQKFRILAFDRVKAGRFELAIAPAVLGRSFILGAVRGRGTPAEPVRNWMRTAIIATGEKVPQLAGTRFFGVNRTPIDRDDALDLTAPGLTQLFRIDAGEEIERHDNLLVVENADPEGPAEMLLYLPRDIGDAAIGADRR